MIGRFVGLHVAAHRRDDLEQPPRGVEGIANGDIDILMGLVLRPGAADVHVLPRHAEIDPHSVELAFVLMAMRRLDDDVAADDTPVELLELGDLLANARLDGGRGVHILEAEL